MREILQFYFSTFNTLRFLQCATGVVLLWLFLYNLVLLWRRSDDSAVMLKSLEATKACGVIGLLLGILDSFNTISAVWHSWVQVTGGNTTRIYPAAVNAWSSTYIGIVLMLLGFVLYQLVQLLEAQSPRGERGEGVSREPLKKA